MKYAGDEASVPLVSPICRRFFVNFSCPSRGAFVPEAFCLVFRRPERAILERNAGRFRRFAFPVFAVLKEPSS
jgi:hypothetical protein